MKKIIFILLFTTSLFAQDIEIQNKLVEGILYSGNETFLILDNGFIKINESDSYEKYYRKIYNDSTIINPNTVIRNSIDLNIIPFINPAYNSRKHFFKQPMNLGLFINLQNYQRNFLTPEALKIIDSLKVQR